MSCWSLKVCCMLGPALLTIYLNDIVSSVHWLSNCLIKQCVADSVQLAIKKEASQIYLLLTLHCYFSKFQKQTTLPLFNEEVLLSGASTGIYVYLLICVHVFCMHLCQRTWGWAFVGLCVFNVSCPFHTTAMCVFCHAKNNVHKNSLEFAAKIKPQRV